MPKNLTPIELGQVTSQRRVTAIHININHRDDGPPELQGYVNYDHVVVDAEGKRVALIPPHNDCTVAFNHAQVGTLPGWQAIYTAGEAFAHALKDAADAPPPAQAPEPEPQPEPEPEPELEPEPAP